MFNKEKKFEKLKKINLLGYLSRCNPLDVGLTELYLLVWTKNKIAL